MGAGEFQYAPWREERRIKPFFELTSLKEISGNAPIRIRSQSWFNQSWALFFLQGYKVEMPNPLLFLRDLYATIKAGTTEQIKGAVVLTEEKELRVVWRNEIFSLLTGGGGLGEINLKEPPLLSWLKAWEFLSNPDDFRHYGFR